MSTNLNSKRPQSFLILALILLGLGYLVQYYAHSIPDIQRYEKQLEDKLMETEKELYWLMQDRDFLVNAIEGTLLSDSVSHYMDKPYTVIIYDEKDSLLWWNNNYHLPFQSDIQFNDMEIDLKYEIGQSVLNRKRKVFNYQKNKNSSKYNVDVLIPIFEDYSLRNEYIVSRFPLMDETFSEYVNSNDASEITIENSNGVELIGIEANHKYPYNRSIHFSSIFYLMGILLIYLSMYAYGRKLILKKHYLSAILLMPTVYLLTRIALVFFDFPDYLHQYESFNIRFSELNNNWFYALSDFMYDMLLVFGMALFYSLEFKKIKIDIHKRLIGIALGFSTFLWICLGFSLIQLGIRDIVMSSVLSFEFDDISLMDIYSFLSLSSMGLMLASYFLISYRLVSLSNKYRFNNKALIALFALALMLNALVAWYFHFLIVDQLLIAAAVSFQSVLLFQFVNRKSSSLAWISIWLLFYSATMTFMLSNANTDRNIKIRKAFAQKIADERDLDLEQTFLNMEQEISNDGLLKISLSNPLSPAPRKQAINLMTFRYFDNYFYGNYSYDIHIYYRNGKKFKGEMVDFSDFESQYQQAQKTKCKHLRFRSDSKAGYSYLAKVPILLSNKIFAYVFIRFEPIQGSKKSNIYVELLSRKRNRTDLRDQQFEYALYKSNQRVRSNSTDFQSNLNPGLILPDQGSYLKLEVLDEPGDAEHDEAKDLHFLIYKSDYNPNNVTLVKIPPVSILKVLSVFAYLFCFAVLMLLFAQVFNFIFKSIWHINLIPLQFEDSLREQIQRGIILVTMASFIAIALITILYYSFEYDSYHKSRLNRKIKSTERTASWKITQDSLHKLPSAVALSDIHNIDVNIYDLSGNLISSSENVIFDRHLISKKMNPMALLKMKREAINLFTQVEKINNFEYLAAYMPLKDPTGEVVAFLNLPYDLAGSKNIGSQDVAKFLGTLLNVYVIFLLLAGFAAFFIANSVTNPLSVIARKLSNVELGKKNDPIRWDKKDEIGELVQRYNQMILELEESTKNLARSQRESAWREMAKQVAHEIKNPLTPMKLNIQLLDKVSKMDPEKSAKMIERVSKTLIEQIDGLALIASEFSNFAKMPLANNEVLLLNEIVHSSYNLFKEEKNVQLYLKMDESPCMIYADKTQMMRVLNNLLKNAIQSIPEDKDGLIKITLQKDKDHALISIEDNGVGIPDAQKEDIFVPNFTTKSSGSGIGLAMSKTIIEMAKGDIYFHSVVNEGSTFHVKIPLTDKKIMS